MQLIESFICSIAGCLSLSISHHKPEGNYEVYGSKLPRHQMWLKSTAQLTILRTLVKCHNADFSVCMYLESVPSPSRSFLGGSPVQATSHHWDSAFLCEK